MPLDTLTYTRTLKAAGVSPTHAEAQAQALVDILSTEMVTRVDLERLEGGHAPCAPRADLEALRSQMAACASPMELEALRSQVAQCATQADLETLLRNEALGLRGDMLSALERVYAEQTRLETRLTRYVLVSSILVGLLAAVSVAAKWL
jgi:hypothetical protein